MTGTTATATRPARYPLTLDLSGRQVLVVGGGRVAARRVRSLIAAAAQVRVVSPEVCDELDALVEAGQVQWEQRGYAGASDLAGAWLVHTATGDPVVDAAVGADCQDQQIWAGDAGSAARSRAWVPARADLDTPDGPVTLAVSAAGDPRRAGAVRDQLAQVLRSGQVDVRRRRPRPGGGWVALVGGGPGDPGLLTTRGRELLAAADVVVVDRLAPRSVLATLPDDVLVVDVGKQPGRHRVRQEEINALLIEHGNAGRGVVRLKGGDPFVLGRGGEERQACQDAGLAVEVVPGVTSAVAVPAAAGIPLTHRGLASGFSVVTGHDQLGAIPTGADHTVVILMGVAALAASAQSMIAAGRSPQCPAAVVEDGFGPSQRVTVAPLHRIAAAAAAVGVQSPAVVVVGDVVTVCPAWQSRSASEQPTKEQHA